MFLFTIVERPIVPSIWITLNSIEGYGWADKEIHTSRDPEKEPLRLTLLRKLRTKISLELEIRAGLTGLILDDCCLARYLDVCLLICEVPTFSLRVAVCSLLGLSKEHLIEIL